MEEQLVKLETAKLAKEKGFDWDCIYVYSKETLECEKLPYWIGWNGEINNREISENCEEYLATAPTQSLLQKWLREVHKRHISIEVSDHGKYVAWEMIDDYGEDDDITLEDFKDTYEEALEQILFETLETL